MLAANHGDQVLTSSYAGTSTVKSVVTKDSSTGKYYVTVVNPGGNKQNVTVDLTSAGPLPSSGTAVTLASTLPSDTNSMLTTAAALPSPTRCGGAAEPLGRLLWSATPISGCNRSAPALSVGSRE